MKVSSEMLLILVSPDTDRREMRKDALKNTRLKMVLFTDSVACLRKEFFSVFQNSEQRCRS